MTLPARYSPRRRRRHRRRLASVLLVGAVVAVGLCSFWLIARDIPLEFTPAARQSRILAAPSAAPRASGDDRDAAPAAPEQREDLLLVNFDHPLPAGYAPRALSSLNENLSGLALFAHEQLLADPDCLVALRELLVDARRDGIEPYLINSAYRSIDQQEILYRNRLASDPTYFDDPYSRPVKCMSTYCSEHSTGLALDILSSGYTHADEGYGETRPGRWLAEHCWRYGFILRYPADKQHVTGVIYEPWHLRYVGKSAAQAMQESGQCLEEYLAAQ